MHNVYDFYGRLMVSNVTLERAIQLITEANHNFKPGWYFKPLKDN